VDRSETARFLCCTTDPVRITLYAPKKGVVPGQNLDLAGELENKTDSVIEDAKLQIMQVEL